MLPRCSAAFLLVLALFLGVAIADQRPSSVSDVPDTLHLFGTTAVKPAQLDGHAIRKAHRPVTAQLRSEPGETRNLFFVERHERRQRPRETRLVIRAQHDAASPKLWMTIPLATGPPLHSG